MVTFSKEELNYIASQTLPYLLEMARSSSLEIDDVDIIDDYSGITSMPAYDNGGGLKRIVRVPLSVFAKPAEDAAKNLKDAADHPTYIGEDYYVYKWNNDTKVYEKTDIYVRGEAFKVNVVWASEAEMKADTKTYDEGSYGMISTGDVEQQENGVVYVYKNGVWDFFVDMSGKRGADGKTAQFRIGTVTNGDTALASVVENGEDEDGNPIYLINLVLPKGDKGDAITWDGMTETEKNEVINDISESIGSDIKGVLDNVGTATNNANTAAKNANEAADRVDKSILDVSTQKQEALEAAQKANKAANELETIIPTIVTKKILDCEEDFIDDFSISDGNGYDIVQFSDGHIKTKNFDSRIGNYNILCIGDSLTAGGSTTKNYLGETVDKLPYPTRMKELFPQYNWVNLGVGGENVNTIFGRIGAIPFVITSDVIIPSDSSSKVEIQLASSWTDAGNDEYQQNVFPFRQGGTQWYNQVYINGHTCKLTYTITDGSYAYFAQRLEDGVEIKVSKGTRIYTQYASLRPKLIIIFAGFNDLPTSSIPYSVDRYIEQIKTCISVFNAECIVISKHTIYSSRTATESTLDERINEEKKLQKTFGANYLDWRKYASSQAIYDAIDKGYIDNKDNKYPTSDDLKWMSEGQIPTTLMSDSVHLNREGTLIFCDYLKNCINELKLL